MGRHTLLSDTRTVFPDTGRDDGPPYLLVIEDGSSSVLTLPRDGAVVVGRGAEAELRLHDKAASRFHARFLVAAGEVRVVDLDSHNGTRVNDDRIADATPLISGDVVAIGDTVLVVHCGARAQERRPLVELPHLRRRLDEEIARSLAADRPFGLLSIGLAREGLDRAAVARAAAGCLRPFDLGAWGGTARLVFLLPERGPDEIAAAAARIAQAIGAPAQASTSGFAVCPTDGCDGETLLQAAGAAAGQARAGAPVAASSAADRIAVGDRIIVVADPAMRRIFELIRRLAASDLPVLVSGESGVGKEHAARAVHAWSRREGKPFVTLNCAAIAENLVESELFGHEKGAFSGAVASKPGLLESADGGSVFLDEVGELSPAVQAKLLRALETKRLLRVGGLSERAADFRIIAATNRNLEEEVKAGRFREDLFFRLSAATVVLPPLRDRPCEIALLSRTFLDEACARAERPAMAIAAATMQRLSTYRWPGNVRELKNVMDYVAAAVAHDAVRPDDLPERLRRPDEPRPAPEAARGATPPAPVPAAPSSATPTPSAGTPAPPAAVAPTPSFRQIADEIDELERTRMEEALAAAGGVQTRAAELIGMPLRTFVKKLKRHAIDPRAANRR